MKRLVLILLLFCASDAMATITRLQVVRANTGNTSLASLTITMSAVTAGSYIVITGTEASFGALKVVPGAADKDWVGGTISSGFNTGSLVYTFVLFYKVITGGQTSVTISHATGNITGAAVLAEYSGKNITPDVWRFGPSGTSTALATNTTDTTNYANELVVAAMGQRCCSSGGYASEQTAWASAPTNGFSIVSQSSTFVNTTNNDRSIAYLEQIVTSTGTYSTGVTSASSNPWACGIVTFREVPQVVARMSAD